MKQIIVIHGGNPFDTYEDYIGYLKNRPVRFERYRMKDWKENLSRDLGPEYDVIMPGMPSKENVKYSEWKIWFERLIPFFEEEVVFIGHSLGGIFLAKWLSENEYPKKIRSVILVAAPYEINGTGQANADFKLNADLSQFEKQANNIHLFHSDDDPVVNFADTKRYTERLAHAQLHSLTGKQHINGSEFPEIVETLKNVMQK
jgi:predicted alpha/beta hydrolase family esterase